MPGSAATDVGDRVHAVHRGGDDAGVAVEAGLERRGCIPWKVSVHGGIALDRDLEALALGPNVQAGSRCSSPMNQLTRSGDDRLAVDGALPGEALGGDGARARARRPACRSARWRRPSRGSCASRVEGRRPARRPPCRSTGRSRRPGSQHRALRRLLGRLAEQHDLAHDVSRRRRCGCRRTPRLGRADVPRERRQHQRDPLGDAAGVDAGAVQRDPPARQAASTRRRRGCETGRTSRGVTTFLPARGAGRLRPRRRASGCRGRSRRRWRAARRRRWWPSRRRARCRRARRRRARPSSALCTQRPDELELGVGEHALDGRPADVAGGPLDHAKVMCRSPSFPGRSPCSCSTPFWRSRPMCTVPPGSTQGEADDPRPVQGDRQGSHRHRAGRGVGAGIATALAEVGADVVVAARSADQIECTGRRCGRRATARRSPPTSPSRAQLEHLVEATVAEFGRPTSW